jgi:hypothetical protein
MQVQRQAIPYFVAGRALIAGRGLLMFTVDGLCHNSGQSGFADSPDPGKKHGMSHPIFLYGIPEGTHNGSLTDNLIKSLRPVFSG